MAMMHKIPYLKVYGMIFFDVLFCYTVKKTTLPNKILCAAIGLGLWCDQIITGVSRKAGLDIDHVFSVNLVRKI